ncbi:plasmid transfer protein TraA [Kitasatospora phosalacinea]|uniref:plasmid transfer protein TraA n=1 Tax=Kitasatospora phosalacinea TaxID=2065 RepID=UPI00365D262A
MSTPPNSPFPPPRRSGAGSGPSRPTPPPQGGRAGGGGGKSYHFHYNPGAGGRGGNAGGGPGRMAGSGGQQIGGGQSAGGRPNYSPLGDPEFFTNADVRAYCERGRGTLMQVSFELMLAHEILQAVLKEVPDPDGRPFGASARARRVARHLKKAADDAKDCAAELARTYAAFQREFDPELTRNGRPRQQHRRPFDFNA